MEATLARGVLLVQGLAVEGAAAAHAEGDVVPEASRRRREDRDGPRFHVTLCSKDELVLCDRGSLASSARQLCRESTFVPLGVGVARAGKASCSFVAVLWPEAQRWRSEFGLPPCDLHITLGFDPHDVHGDAVRKGPRQLLPLRSVPSVRPPDWHAACEVTRVAARAAATGREESVLDVLAAVERLLELAAGVAEPPAEGQGAVEETWGAGGAAGRVVGGADDGANGGTVLAELRQQRASLLGRLGRQAEALEEAEAACRLAPRMARALLVRAAIHCSLQQWDEAQAWLRRVPSPVPRAPPLEADEAQRLERLARLCERRIGRARESGD